MCKKKRIRVLFQGDSITDACRNRLAIHSLAGYPKKTAEILINKYGKQKYNFFNRGISGDRSINLLKRYKYDTAALHPEIVTVMIGINDVWRKYDRNDPTSPETYYKNLEELFIKIKEELNAKLIVMSPYLTPDEKHSEMRADVDIFIATCKKAADKYADAYINTDVPLNLAAKTCNKNDLSKDGVHPEKVGQEVIAKLLAEKIEALS